MTPYDFYGGDYEEMKKHCQRIMTPVEKVNYIEWCLAEMEKVILDRREEEGRIARAIWPNLDSGDSEDIENESRDRAVHLNPKHSLQKDLRYWKSKIPENESSQAKVQDSPAKPAAQGVEPPASTEKQATQLQKIPWLASRTQLLDFFCYAINPSADLPTAELYFACRGSKDTTIPDSAPRLQTYLHNNHFRYAFKVAQDLFLLNLEHQDAELPKRFLNRNGSPLKFSKENVSTDVRESVRERIKTKLQQIKSASMK